MILRTCLTISIACMVLLGGASLPARSQEVTSGPFIIAHNAGNDPDNLSGQWVLASDLIEIDVLVRDSQLVAGHPISFTSAILTVDRSFPALLPLETAWEAVLSASAIQLDMKSHSLAAIHLLIDFLHQHGKERTVLVTARDSLVLQALDLHIPHVCRYLSVPSMSSLEAVVGDSKLLGILDGVAVREELLDQSLLTRLHKAGLLVAVWTVNELERAAELIEWGVDGVATDNPAIAITYGGRGSGDSQVCDRE